MSDEDEQQLKSHMTSINEVDGRRRLSDIKFELQGLMRQKKKYDEEKLKQDSEFLQNEINALRTSISEVNKEINNQTQTKKRLHVQMTNLRSRSRLRYTNLAIALRDKRRYEAELKKENKTEEYRALAQREIRSIEAALPILKEEDEYKAHLKTAEDAQQAATIKRKKLEESLNKNLRKQTEIKQLLSENAEKLPQIEATIESLRSERERLLSSANSLSTNGKKCRRRLHSNQQKLIDSPTTGAQTPIRSFQSIENDCFEHEKQQCEEQLNKINTLINYFREKLSEHDLNNDQICLTPSSELTSLLYHPLTSQEEQTILSSYMEDRDSGNTLLTKTSNNQSTTAIAMKLPRNFLPLKVNSTTTNEIIHSPYYDENEIEYKKELSSDILNKYGGHTKKNKQQQSSTSFTGKKHKKYRKNFGIIHIPQMIALYNNVRSLTGSSDTLPSMPMYEYDLFPTIQSLEFLKQSLESYLIELKYRYQNNFKSLNDDEQQSKSGIEIDDDDIRDSALDTFSETSSLIEPMNISKQLTNSSTKLMNILEVRSSTSSDDKKPIDSSSSPPSSNHSDSKKDYQDYLNSTLTKIEELNSQFSPLTIQIDRQISDEGYRSVRNEQQQQITRTTSNHNLPSLTRSESYDSTEKVDQWLSTTSPLASSLPISINYNTNFQPTDIDDEE
ncbi:unnamed protein product [Rotaria sordida]|uniref:Uncharacterized protein n=1 Tax=Rotaria sordida TaxID=392033 RepID=A0A819ARP5_9BILA|nr:unnamed protein product [Rotaria sordida]